MIFGLEHRQRRRRVGRPHHVDARAGADRHQRVARAADVEERHRDLRARFGGEVLLPRHVLRVPQHAAVREHRALRKASRARGIELNETIAGRAGVWARIRIVRGQPRFVLVFDAVDANHPLDRRQLSAQLLDCAAELRPDEQQARLGVVDDVGDLGRREPEVDDGVRRADLGAGEGQLDARGMVEVEHRDAVAGRKASRAQARGGPSHALRQLGPGLGRAGEREGDGVGLRRFPVGQDCGEVGRIGQGGLLNSRSARW